MFTGFIRMRRIQWVCRSHRDPRLQPPRRRRRRMIGVLLCSELCFALCSLRLWDSRVFAGVCELDDFFFSFLFFLIGGGWLYYYAPSVSLMVYVCMMDGCYGLVGWSWSSDITQFMEFCESLIMEHEVHIDRDASFMHPLRRAK